LLDGSAPFKQRDDIKRRVARRIKERSTDAWLTTLDAADVWCAKVLQWPELLGSEGFGALDMLQTVTRGADVSIRTTRSPIRVDGKRSEMSAAAPLIGQDNARLRQEFGL